MTLTSTASSRTSPRRQGLLLALLCVAQFMVYLDISIVNVALPSIQESLGMAAGDLPYVVTAYGTVLGGFLLLGGRLADVFGRRRVLQIGLTVFAGTSLLAGLATDPAVLIAARGAQGLGAALVTPAALSILMDAFEPGPARNKALGIWGSLTGIASVCGVLFGGVLTDGVGWRWIFWVNVPIGLAAVALAPFVLPESREPARRRFDVAGAVVLTAGLLLLIHTLDQAVELGWDSPRTIGGLLLAGALLIGFVRIELRTHSPLLPMSIFARRTLRTANIVSIAVMGAVVTLFFFASLYMQQVLGWTPMRTGVAYVPLASSVAAAAGVASVLVTRFSPRVVLVSGLVVTATGLLMLSRLGLDAAYAAEVLPAFVIVGVGLGLTFVPVQIMALDDVDEQEFGVAAGLVSTSQEAGGALGLAVVSTIVLAHIDSIVEAGRETAVAAQLSGFQLAFVAAACWVLGALAVVLVDRVLSRR
ncbi:MFS transporter [Aeromicrobium sp. UC242_57]|uniref:MFS transporter n=1 Tax=Aeromicrobium sp. UC242_57 TaxID=3374624 RepID=UPI0037A19733